MNESNKTCPKCGSSKIKDWRDLTDDQKVLVKSLPASAEFPLSKRKQRRFCTRCWYESDESRTSQA